jgi:outer membrane protein assembly factor BamA
MPVGRITCSGNGRTRAGVILQEVLLRPGERFDPALARESERNLRSRQYLGSVRIVPHPDPERGVVDLEVAVTDSWPWVGAVIPSSAGGQEEVVIIAGNGNFLGRGQEVGLFGFLSSEVADSYALYFSEPRLFGSRWSGSFRVGRQGDVGNLNGLEIRRPLFALSTEWAYDVALFDETSERLLYASGATVSDYYRKRRGVNLGVERSFRTGDRRLEIEGRYTYEDDEHEQETGWTGVLPADKRRGTATVSLTAETFRFAETRFLNQMGPVEDLRLGLRGTLRAGGAAGFLGSDRGYPVLGGGLRWFALVGDRGYALAETQADARIEEGRFTNAVVDASLRLYRRVAGPGMLAWRGAVSAIARMEDPEQLLLDSPNGLRGYDANAYEGTRRLLTNLEWRQPFHDGGWVVVGSAVFVDGGIIWTRSRSIADAPFLVGAGAGLRLGFPGMLGAPVVRLDLGYGFRVRSTEMSFGFEQRF